ncbi:MAG: hypothetical protein NVSMB51_00290 [Solirubrobacteraceae bacterium]
MTVVWRADVDEAETVARLLVEFRNHLGHNWPSDNAFLAGVERLIERPAEAEFLLCAPSSDSPPAGGCQLRYRFSIWTAALDCWLEDLYVCEAARRRGLGRALLEFGCARARERGCRRIELDAAESNEAALAMYRASGFSSASKGHGRDLFMGRPLVD